MLADLATAIITVMVLLAGTVMHPERAECPGTHWYLSHGVDHAGRFRCSLPPIGGDDDVLTGRETAIDQPGELRGRVYCSGGSVPIVVDYRTVGCTRRSGS